MFSSLRTGIPDFNIRNSMNTIREKASPHIETVKVTYDSHTSKIKAYIDKNKKRIMIVLVIFFITVIYFVIFFRRVPRFLARMNKNYSACKITSIQYNKKIMDGNYKLNDFYIASSYKSYLPCTNYMDYASIESIQRILFYGGRHIDIDIMNYGFGCNNLVVCAGREKGNWHYTTSLQLEKTLEFISKYAFGKEVPNGGDPLFLSLNFNTWYNNDAFDECAALIKKFFLRKLLPIEYGYKGRESKINICSIPIKNILDKIVIICNDNVENTDMDELVNMGSSDYGNIRTVTHKEILDCKDIKEFRDFNKTYMTKVVPSFEGRMKRNYNYLLPFYLGCQFICMNYTEPDQWMKLYVNTFSEYSFVLKPYKLRHQLDKVKTPFSNSY
jgi:hypothetical protein